MALRDSFADRISELERWREHEVDPALARLEAETGELVNERRIAAGVAEELRKRGITPEGVAERTATKTTAKLEEHGGLPRVPLTWYQKLGAFVASAILLADAVRGLLS